MSIVLDASALAEYLVSSGLGSAVAGILARDSEVHVPHLAVVETTSVLRGWVLGGHLRAERAAAALTDLAAFPGQWWPAEPLLPRIWQLRDNLSAYDATNVALAEALDATLVTADSRLARVIVDTAYCQVELVDRTLGSVDTG